MEAEIAVGGSSTGSHFDSIGSYFELRHSFIEIMGNRTEGFVDFGVEHCCDDSTCSPTKLLIQHLH